MGPIRKAEPGEESRFDVMSEGSCVSDRKARTTQENEVFQWPPWCSKSANVWSRLHGSGTVLHNDPHLQRRPSVRGSGARTDVLESLWPDRSGRVAANGRAEAVRDDRRVHRDARSLPRPHPATEGPRTVFERQSRGAPRDCSPDAGVGKSVAGFSLDGHRSLQIGRHASNQSRPTHSRRESVAAKFLGRHRRGSSISGPSAAVHSSKSTALAQRLIHQGRPPHR